MLKKLYFFILLLSANTVLAQTEYQLHYPDMVIEGVETRIEITSNQSLRATITLNNQEVTVMSDGASSYIYLEADPEVIMCNEATVAEKNKGAMIPLWMSILPPLLAIILALVFKEVIFSLVSGIFLGGAIMGVYAEGPSGIFTGFFKIIDTYILGAVTDSGHLSVIVFSTIIGGIVALLSKNGGMKGIVN